MFSISWCHFSPVGSLYRPSAEGFWGILNDAQVHMLPPPLIPIASARIPARQSSLSNQIKAVPLGSLSPNQSLPETSGLGLLPCCSEEVADPGAEGSVSLTSQSCFRVSVPSYFLLLSSSGKQAIMVPGAHLRDKSTTFPFYRTS